MADCNLGGVVANHQVEVKSRWPGHPRAAKNLPLIAEGERDSKSHQRMQLAGRGTYVMKYRVHVRAGG